ncbi:MAG: YceI family protein [Bacteroidales bacterium]|nr:YceI family protein [Bacteroidales bacterium]MDD4175487.1 YceI family protein [Bacteroidales bacterium]
MPYKRIPPDKICPERGRGSRFIRESAELTGMLTIAGKTKEVKVPVDFIISPDQQFTASGKVPLKMSDFGIEPPTVFFGTITTNNEVEVKFNFEFNKGK